MLRGVFYLVIILPLVRFQNLTNRRTELKIKLEKQKEK